MKGTVVLVWIESLKGLFGDATITEVLQEMDLEGDQMITPTMDVSEENAVQLVEKVAKKVGKNSAEIFRQMGRNNIWSFKEFFPSYFDQNSAKEFLCMMDEVHRQLTKMIEGANPPRLIAEELSPNRIKLRYESNRGLFDYLLGLIEGVGDYFEEEVELEELSRGEASNGTKYIEVNVTTEKSTGGLISYPFSQFLSLGFIKNIPAKIAFLSSIIITLASAVLSGFQMDLSHIGVFIISFIVIFGAAKVSLSPLSILKKEVNKLEKLDYSQSTQVKTGDNIEALMNEIFDAKNNIKKDLLFLKGGTDDMYKFVERFGGVSENMKNLSDDISKMVEEVSEGAMQQAYETEGSADRLNTNVENIKKIANEELKDKEYLKEAVQNIQDSYQQITNVAENLDDVKQQFAGVDSQGKELSKNVESMLEIVTTVEEISEQTNLLALNASIEAARAGEHGQGFAVVADEVRNLAENSGKAVATISDNLKSFVKEVEGLVKNITDQFSRLEESTNTLQNTASETGKATDQINDVADKIAEMADKLSEETENINQVFESINSLAAIAEENSAASEEMSSNVSEYSERIKEMTKYTEQLKALAEEFRSELKKHRV
ncbi:heme NO-binding domain-containing protein [Natranaerofaba carboxydovora]|uniref:heme NO-binding domain-containing protein n=1 Tax=Natranaerofaba carboxydovora TaxID=2742683 RepID=UPI001F145B84|nr:heme NO-binding domain-containing protein [Natranaerofaba carboxydovora]UMZ72935.1 Methyl-accepting chemotaxis protein 4 [Natranaerofaba carboxydovora]